MFYHICYHGRLFGPLKVFTFHISPFLHIRTFMTFCSSRPAQHRHMQPRLTRAILSHYSTNCMVSHSFFSCLFQPVCNIPYRIIHSYIHTSTYPIPSHRIILAFPYILYTRPSGLFSSGHSTPFVQIHMIVPHCSLGFHPHVTLRA